MMQRVHKKAKQATLAPKLQDLGVKFLVSVAVVTKVRVFAAIHCVDSGGPAAAVVSMIFGISRNGKGHKIALTEQQWL